METENPLVDQAQAEPQGKYDNPKNLVYETKQLSNKSSQQINCTKLKAQQLIVSKWLFVEPVAQKLFVKMHTKENRQNSSTFKQRDKADDKDSSSLRSEDYGSELDGYNDSATNQDQSAYSGPPMNFKDAGYDSEINLSMSNDSSQMSAGMMEMQDNFQKGKSDFYFAKTTMLQPTSISVLLVSRQQYKKINFSDTKMSMEPVSCKFDFKDMDLVYYLYSRWVKEYNAVSEHQSPSNGEESKDAKSEAAKTQEEE